MAEAPESAVLLDCAICLENLNNPRILPCSHSFCYTCIDEYIVSTVSKTEQKSFNCPTCRNVVDVKDPTVDKSKWASFLPLIEHETKLEEQTSLEENSKQMCNPCQLFENKRYVEAYVWCKECNEALCRNCCETHDRLKISRFHQTVQVENADKERLVPVMLGKILEANEMCAVHENKMIVAFCFDHSEMCCVLCLTLKHQTCENTQAIEEIQEIKEENVLKLESDLQKLLSQFHTFVNEKEENIALLETSFKKVKDEVSTFVIDSKNKLDDLNNEFHKNSQLLKEELQNDLSSNVKQIREYISVFDRWLKNIKVVRSFGSKLQIFAARQTMKSELLKLDEDINSISENSKKVTVAADLTQARITINHLVTLGNIAVSKTEDFPSLAHCTHGLGLMKGLKPGIEFESVVLKPFSYFQFFGKELLSSVNVGDELCVVLFSDKTVHLLNISSKSEIDAVVIDGLPKRLCYNMVTKMLYVTCHCNAGFTYNLNDFKIGGCKSHSFQAMICGIDVYDKNVMMIMNKAILVSNKFIDNSTFMQALVDGSCDDIAVDRQSERLAVLKRKSSTIHFTTMKAKTLKPFIGNDKLNNVKGISFGPSGLLFVATDNPCSIRVISRDEMKIRTILTKFEKLRSVKNIHVDKRNYKLYVCGDGYLEIFDIQ